MHKTLLILSILAVATLAATSNFKYHELCTLWSAWKALHSKSYTTLGEPDARFAIFVENHNKILKKNAENTSVKYGLSKFADLTVTEFKMKHSMCGFKETNQDIITQNTKPFDQNGLHDLPKSVDWRKNGVVTYTKDQEDCGSCWAFSATGVLEGFYAIKYGKLLEFSEQQIVSCDTADQGCNGG